MAVIASGFDLNSNIPGPGWWLYERGEGGLNAMGCLCYSQLTARGGIQAHRSFTWDALIQLLEFQ